MAGKPKTETAITAYKAFDADMSCHGHKFEVGETYTVKGKPVLCGSVFYACENPFDVLDYCDLCDARFARVTLASAIDREAEGKEVCAASITLDAEISLPRWIEAAVSWLLDGCKCDENTQAASGDCSKLAASGDYSQLAASGDCSKLAASGDCSKLAASGDCSQLAASGDCSKLAASGDCSKLDVTGENSAVAAVGHASKVKASAGTPVSICEYTCDGKAIAFASGVAGKDFPADVWVMASGGKLVEVSA